MAVNTNIAYSIAQNAGEFLAGIASSIKADSAKELADELDRMKLIEKLETDLRDIYDRFIPNVHIVNIDNYFNLLISNLVKYPDKFTKDNDYSVVTRLADKNSQEYKSLYSSVNNNISKYHQSLLSQQSNQNPIMLLNELSATLFNRTRNIDNAVSARYLGSEFAKRISVVFGNRSVLATIDPSITSQPNTYIFFSRSFTSVVAAFKEKVGRNIEKDLGQILGTSAAKDISVGSVINFGHAAIKNETGYYINSPAFASALFGVGSGRSKRFGKDQLQQAASAFKTESKIIDNYIEVEKDFTSSGKFGVLLSLGVTITLPEDWDINQSRGRTTEKSTVKSFGITAQVPRTRSERIRYTAALAKRAYKKLVSNIEKGTSSRSIEQFILELTLSTLTGKKVASEKSKKVISEKVKVTSVVKTGKKSTKFTSPKSTVSIARIPNVTTTSTTNLISLQNLINQNLARQIQSNMGTGSSTKVLNYRTGRLANSAKVEKMSESRQGMITAFYSYMRNPYGTFSEGGRQQYPKSRDPKILISKSIRELATPEIAVRMRAVLV